MLKQKEIHNRIELPCIVWAAKGHWGYKVGSVVDNVDLSLRTGLHTIINYYADPQINLIPKREVKPDAKSKETKIDPPSPN